MEILTQQLNNGLRLAAARIPHASFVDLVVMVRAGSRYDPKHRRGLSHFLEHMLYRGCEKYPSSYLLNREFEWLGDGLEGGTTHEYTLYVMELPPENLSAALKALKAWQEAPLFLDVKTERGIIFEEILEEVDEHGHDNDLSNISRKLIFGEHPLGRPILGRKATLSGLTRRELKKFFHRYYRPDQMILVASGAVEPAMFFKEARAAFGKFMRPDTRSVVSTKPPSPRRGPHVEFHDETASQIEVLASFIADGERSPRFVSQMALERVLDDGLSSRLQRRLCEKRGLLYDISVSMDGFTDIGVMDFSFRIAKSKARTAFKEIFDELNELRTVLLPEDEFEKLKKRMKRETRSIFHNPRYLSVRIAESTLLDFTTPVTPEQWEKQIESLTAEDIRRAAQRVFAPERLVVVIQGDLPKQEQRQLRSLIATALS